MINFGKIGRGRDGRRTRAYGVGTRSVDDTVVFLDDCVLAHIEKGVLHIRGQKIKENGFIRFSIEQQYYGRFLFCPTTIVMRQIQAFWSQGLEIVANKLQWRNEARCYLLLNRIMAESESFEVEAVIFVTILLVYVLTSHLIEIRQVPYLHQSTVAIIMGFLTAVFARYTFGEDFKFSGQLFFTIILPPIIFSAGYSLRKSLFFENFGIISFLGIVGTLIGFTSLVIILYCLNKWVFLGTLSTEEVLMVSSVLCATDTVAAMSLIKPDKYPVLNAVLFGQGIINDAVAIILFRTVSQLKLEEDGFTFGTVLNMFFSFLYLFFFSLTLGLVSGFGLSYLLKINESFIKFPIKETSLILLNGYLTYLIGEVTGLSGIISLFTCAIVMGHYSFMNISEEAQRGTGLAFQTVSYVAQAFVFAYLGASVLSINSQWLAVGMAFLVLATLPGVRAIMVYALPCIYALMKREFPLNKKEVKVCWYSGMVRGVIAFALCLQIEGVNQDFIRTMAMMVVMVTTILGSSLLKSFSKFIGLDDEMEEDGHAINYQRMLDDRLTLSQGLSNYHNIGLGYQSDHPNPKSDGEKESTTTKKIEQFQAKFVRPHFQKKNNKLNYEMQNGLSNDQL